MDDEEEDMSLQRPVSQCWGTPFRDIKFQGRDSRDRVDTRDRSTQTSAGPNAIVPQSEGHNIMVPQGHNNNNTFPCGVQDNPQANNNTFPCGVQDNPQANNNTFPCGVQDNPQANNNTFPCGVQDNPQANNNTFPCGVQDNPQARTLFHGNAGFRLHFPAQFEPLDDRGERQNGEGEERRRRRRRRMEERPEEERAGDSAEARIGRKLQEIGDQFHQDHVQLFLQHQRDVLPVWMRLTMALYGFLFNREAPAVPRLRGQER